MYMMMVMRSLPDAGRCQDEQAIGFEDQICHFGTMQHCPVLMVMINNKHPHHEKSSE
jgi:hypothetical protein